MRDGNSGAMDTLYDLTRPNRRVRGDSKVMWALIIIFVTTVGPILYFLAGREPE